MTTPALAPLFVGTPDELKTCPRCRRPYPHPYNAALDRAAGLGLYQGPTLGGFELCDACDGELATEEQALARGLLQSGPLNLPKEFVGANWHPWQAKPGSAAALKAAEAKPDDESDDAPVVRPKGGRKPAKPVVADPPAEDDDGGGEDAK